MPADFSTPSIDCRASLKLSVRLVTTAHFFTPRPCALALRSTKVLWSAYVRVVGKEGRRPTRPLVVTPAERYGTPLPAMSGIVAQDWIWSVPAAPMTRKSRRDIGPQTSRAVGGVYLSSWKSTTTVRPQILCAGSFQYVATPSLNDGGSGAPVPVCGAWMPMLIVLLLMPVESPPAV